MPRRRMTRGARSRLAPAVRLFLETGEAREGTGEDAFLCWVIGAALPEGRALWAEHRAEILAAWRAAGRRGVPWAEQHLTVDDGPEAA